MCPLTYCSYGEARETNHGCSAVHFTEEVSRHFVCENPPPPPAKNLTRNELRLLELSGLSWSERQPTPHGSGQEFALPGAVLASPIWYYQGEALGYRVRWALGPGDDLVVVIAVNSSSADNTTIPFPLPSGARHSGAAERDQHERPAASLMYSSGLGSL